MGLNLEKARVGLKLAVQRINSSVTGYCGNDYDNESPVTNADASPAEARDDNSPMHVNNSFSHEKTMEKENMTKRPRLDNSKHSENPKSKYKEPRSKTKKIVKESAEVSSPPFDTGQPETYASSSSTLIGSVVDSGFVESCMIHKAIEVTTKNTKLGFSKNKEKNTELQKNSKSCDDKIERNESSSTYFSASEDDCYDTPFKLKVTNAPAAREKQRCCQSLTENTSKSTSAHKSSTLYFIRLFLNALEDEIQTLDITKTLLWKESKVKEVGDVFVQLAESNSAKAVQQCKTEAVKSLQKIYRWFLKSSKSPAPFEETQWTGAFSILLTLCDSKSICEEFIKFFTSQMIIPTSTTDLEDPKQIIEGLADVRTARFGLQQLHDALRKYSKFVEASDRRSTLCSESSDLDCLIFRRRIGSTKNKVDIELLRQFNEYSTKICDDFLELNYITTRNIMLLKSKKYSES